jgi:quercetin dioxygenase-like cupin family protein
MFLSLNLPPGSSSPMHRTLTLDYGIVLSGEIVLELDGGQKKTIKAGEFIVQGGVNHKWTNETHEDCQIVFVMVGAEKVKLENGVELQETV